MHAFSGLDVPQLDGAIGGARQHTVSVLEQQRAVDVARVPSVQTYG
jgi:hypothetical protein